MRRIPLVIPYGGITIHQATPADLFTVDYDPLMMMMQDVPLDARLDATTVFSASFTIATSTLNAVVGDGALIRVLRYHYDVIPENTPPVNALESVTWAPESYNASSTRYGTVDPTLAIVAVELDTALTIRFGLRGRDAGGFYLHLATRPEGYRETTPERALLFEPTGIVLTTVTTGLTSGVAAGVAKRVNSVSASDAHYNHYRALICGSYTVENE